MKRLFCIILICITAVFSVGCGAKSKFSAPENLDDSVAQITIYAFNGDSERVPGLINLGHAFTTITNISALPIYIGAFELLPDNEVSVGTWGMNAHWGIWFNVETTYMDIGRYIGRVSITQGVNVAEIQTINAYLAVNDKWTFTKNCSYFAVDLWNIAANTNDNININGLVTPAKVYNRVIATNGFATNRKAGKYAKVGYGAIAPSIANNATNDGFTEFVLEGK